MVSCLFFFSFFSFFFKFYCNKLVMKEPGQATNSLVRQQRWLLVWFVFVFFLMGEGGGMGWEIELP